MVGTPDTKNKREFIVMYVNNTVHLKTILNICHILALDIVGLTISCKQL